MNIIYNLILALLITLTMSFSSNAEWKYVGVNTTGTSFYVDDTSIKPIKEKLIIRQLQNKKKPDKWGSLSTIVNKQLDCRRNLFRILSFEFYYGSMGTNLEKKVSASDKTWKINSKKSMNKMVSDYVCKNQSVNNINKFKLPDCNININPTNWDNCFGTFKNQNGDLYVGDFKKGQYHGNGTYTFSPKGNFSGQVYTGEWLYGKRNGMGINVWGNGEKYIGEWKNDKRDGAGTNSYIDGKIEKGIWKNDKYISQSRNLKKSVIPENKMINASSGTGFAISKKGHLITNYHVIKGCQKVRIHNKSTVIEANVINFDPQNDLALIKGNFIPNQVLSISNDQTNLLQDIYVAGYPFGKKISTSIKITKGIVSSLTGIGNNYSNFQIDAAIQPGNSGGPILNDKGNVIGVAVAKLDLKYASRNFGVIPENTNFGIKSSVIKSILEGESIKIIPPIDKQISKIELGKKITNSTFYLSCWMSYAQIKKMKSQKVIYNEF